MPTGHNNMNFNAPYWWFWRTKFLVSLSIDIGRHEVNICFHPLIWKFKRETWSKTERYKTFGPFTMLIKSIL